MKNYVEKVIDEILRSEEIKEKMGKNNDEIENEIFLKIKNDDYNNIILLYMKEFKNEKYNNIDEFRKKYDDIKYNELFDEDIVYKIFNIIDEKLNIK